MVRGVAPQPAAEEAGQGTLAAQRQLGDYELLEEIGRGGMGLVYRARQKSLKRFVAVKLLLGGQNADEQARKRFRREAEAVAALNHPNIVSIHEIGEDVGQLYFAMELVEGRNLADLTREKQFSSRDASRLLKATAEAVHFAHQQNVLHRDLKPSNIIVDSTGVPHVTDFGLAKQIAGGGDLTLAGQVLGTPNYMSPEQADPKRGPVAEASDIFSLGAILYHLLTGRPPFLADSLTQTLRQVIENDPVSPRLLNPGIPRDLATICLQCLEKDPNRRCRSAQVLADELQRFLNGEPIHARPVSPATKLYRWCRRTPRLAFAIGCAAVLLTIIAVGTPVAFVRIDRGRWQAQDAERRTRQQLYHALLDEGRAAAFSGEVGHRVRALDALRQAATITNSPELRQAALGALRLPDLRFEREVESPHEASPDAVVLNPSFNQVAECLREGPVEIRSAAEQTLLATLAPTNAGNADHVRWSPDGTYLAFTRRTALGPLPWWLEVWDTKTWHCVLTTPSAAPRVVFRPHSTQVLATQRDGITFWDLEKQKPVASFLQTNWAAATNFEGDAHQLAFSTEGEQFAESSFDGSLSIVSVHRSSDGSTLVSAKVPSEVSALAWQPSGRWLAVTDFGGSVTLVDAANGERRTIGHHEAQAATATFSPDGNYLFTGGWERVLICWDMLSLQSSFIIPLDSFNIQFRNDGAECALAGESSWQLHAFERPAAHRQLPEPLGSNVRHAAFSPDGHWLAVAGFERLGVWNLHSTGPAALTAQGADDRLFFSAQNELFGCSDDEYHGWRILDGGRADSPPMLQELQIPQPSGFVSFCQAPDGVLMSSSLGSGLIDTTSGQTQWTPTAQGVSSSSPDGRWMGIFTPYSRVAHIYRLPELSLAANLTNRANILRVQFSPLGSEVAVVTASEFEFWSTTTWQRTRLLTNAVNLLYTPRANGLWLSRSYRTAGLYSAATLELLLPLPRGTLPLALSPDGRYLAVSSDAQRLELWDLFEVRRQLQALGLSWPEAL